MLNICNYQPHFHICLLEVMLMLFNRVNKIICPEGAALAYSVESDLRCTLRIYFDNVMLVKLLR